MTIFTRFRWFQKAAMGIFLAYILLMVYVTVIAHSRDSGSAGIDTTQIVQLRNKTEGDRSQ